MKRNKIVILSSDSKANECLVQFRVEKKSLFQYETMGHYQ